MLKRWRKWVPTVMPPLSGRSTLQCSVAASAAGLKFLHRKSRVRLGISNRQAALEIVDLASALYFPKFVQEGAATDTNFGKRALGRGLVHCNPVIKSLYQRPASQGISR